MTASASFRIDTGEIRKLARAYGQASERIVMDELTTGMVRSGEHARVKANQLIHRRSGLLQDTAVVTTRVSARHVESVIKWVQRYAQWVDRGRGPVVAKRAKALRFVIGGQVIFRKSVGPAPAQNFTGKGLAAAGPGIEAQMRAAASRIVARLGAK